ncbi:MAG TPA: hypothetical protein DEB31_11895 [Clostridiales bacterium]|nr:hypothetical protein [Clostridiales bacterium]
MKNSLNKDGTVKAGSSLSSLFNTTASGTTQNTLKSTMAFARQNTSNLSLLKSMAGALSSAAKSMGSSTLQSSNNSVVTAQASLYGKSNMSFDIGVNNLAASQQSKSASFNSSATSSFGLGNQSFALETEQGNYSIDFTVQAGDTNEDSLNAIAGQINESDANVSAKVTTSNGQSTLELTSNDTGELSYFQLSDESGGNAAARLDMQVTQEGQDASYSINGQGFTSDTNTVSIPGGRGAQMTLTGTGEATLQKATDASGVVSAAKSFASAYNNAVSFLASGNADGAGVTRALGLVTNNRMTAMSAASFGTGASARLSAMGISINQDGMMQVDEEKLTAAAQESPNTVRDALAGYGGMASTAESNAAQAMRIPAATYTNFSNMGVESGLINALMPKTGFLFDIAL